MTASRPLPISGLSSLVVGEVGEVPCLPYLAASSTCRRGTDRTSNEDCRTEDESNDDDWRKSKEACR